MNRIIVCFICIVFILGALITPIHADKKVGKERLKELIVGKTIEGNWTDWDTTYKMYLHPNGSFSRVYGKGNNETGEWRINQKGKLGIIMHNERCRRVKQRADGGYNLYNKQGQLKQTIEKISEGNPHNL